MGIENENNIGVTPLLTPHEKDLGKAITAHQEDLAKLVKEFADAALSRYNKTGPSSSDAQIIPSSIPPRI